MLLDDTEVQERMESPLNLLNRLKSNLDSRQNHLIPSLPPRSSEIIPNLEEKLQTSGIKSKAIHIIDEALNQLKNRMPEVQRPEKLAQIANEVSKIITNTTVAKPDENRTQIIIYSPQLKSESEFEVVHVNE